MLKKFLLPAFCFTFLTSHLFAQQTSRPATGIRSMFSGGVGLIAPSHDMKDYSFIGNGVDFRFGYFQSLYRLSTKKGSMQLGLDLRLNYSKFTYYLDRPGTVPSSVSDIRYNNGSGAPVTVALQLDHKKKRPDAFHYVAGPSVLFSNGNSFFGASLLFGYSSVAQEAFRFYDSIQNPSNPLQNRTINFYSANHETNNGFVFSPGIKAGFRITPHIAFMVAAEYSFGGTHDFIDNIFVPSGAPTNGVYEFPQLANGTTAGYERHSKLRTLLVSGNLVLTLPQR